MKENTQNHRVGFHSIEAIIKTNPHKIKKLILPKNREDKRIEDLVNLIEINNLKYEFSKKVKQEPEAIIQEDKRDFKDLKNHIENLISPVILILDNIIDPRNLGACLRSAAVNNVDAVIINKHHCAPLNAISHKVSAGGVEALDIFYVTNLVNCLAYLTKINIKIFGLSEHAQQSYSEYSYDDGVSFIMGSEEEGIRKKTLERCDELINLSFNKDFKSFNVSVATGIILAEVTKQRK